MVAMIAYRTVKAGVWECTTLAAGVFKPLPVVFVFYQNKTLPGLSQNTSIKTRVGQIHACGFANSILPPPTRAC